MARSRKETDEKAEAAAGGDAPTPRKPAVKGRARARSGSQAFDAQPAAKKAAPTSRAKRKVAEAMPGAAPPKPKPRARKAAAPAPAPRQEPAAAPKPAAPTRPTAPSKPRARKRGKPASVAAPADLAAARTAPAQPNEEEQIEAAKYLPRELPPRLFEEERFVFPESYGVDRVRLLVKDPYWIFAHWDVNPQTLAALRRDVGERAAALARLTLRVTDALHGGTKVVFLPEGARSWYVQVDTTRRTYLAELGLTLPSGEFRRLAGSNSVTPPQLGPSPQQAVRRVRYREAARGVAAAPSVPASAPAPAAAEAGAEQAGPWRPDRIVDAPPPGGASTASVPPGREGVLSGRGGASDAFRGGASDVHRR